MNIQEIAFQNNRWIHITEPDQDMIGFLSENFHFHPLDLEDVLSKVQYPKIDAYKDYLFIILQFPVYESGRKIYKRSELDIFFGKDYIITIANKDLTPLHNFFETCRLDNLARERFMGRGTTMLLYEVIDAMMDYVFPIINQKNDLIFQLEEEIFETPELKDMIQQIMVLKRNIINVRRILHPQRGILMDLGSKHHNFIPQEYAIYFDDVVDKKDKIINQLDTALAYVDVLEDANEALITRSTNKVLKVLAIFSVIPLPLTLLLNYYGMNVNLPFQSDPNILTYINAALLSITAVMIFVFAKMRWL